MLKRGLSAIFIAIYCYALTFGPYQVHLPLLLIIGALSFFELFSMVPKDRRGLTLFALYGAFVATALFQAHHIYQVDSPYLWQCFLFVWFFDTASFFSGKLIGGPKIIPTISPGKTWSGFLGGITLTIIFFTFCLDLFYSSYAMPLVCALCFCLVAFLGDMIESWIKRICGRKDSGHLIPGHGGVLDRFDAFFAVVLFMTAWGFP